MQAQSEMYYGAPPLVLAQNVTVDLVRDKVEMCLYQYLPIKMAGALESFHIPPALEWIKRFVQYLDFCPHTDFVYVTVKHQYVTPDNMGNRPGWHSDGFGSDDVNYIWSDKFPTQFCQQRFELTEDHVTSLQQLNEQARPENIVEYGVNAFVRIDRWNIHRPPVEGEGFRTFLKFSVSKNKYNLQGNSHNYLIDYNWNMVPRAALRNHPTADTGGKVEPTPLTVTLPGAFDKPLSVDMLLDRLSQDNVSVLPIRNVADKYFRFTDGDVVSLEYILRTMLANQGFDTYVNMNQSKPRLVAALVATGRFERTTCITAQFHNNRKPKHIATQRVYHRPVNCLRVLPASPLKGINA